MKLWLYPATMTSLSCMIWSGLCMLRQVQYALMSQLEHLEIQEGNVWSDTIWITELQKKLFNFVYLRLVLSYWLKYFCRLIVATHLPSSTLLFTVSCSVATHLLKREPEPPPSMCIQLTVHTLFSRSGYHSSTGPQDVEGRAAARSLNASACSS